MNDIFADKYQVLIGIPDDDLLTILLMHYEKMVCLNIQRIIKKELQAQIDPELDLVIALLDWDDPDTHHQILHQIVSEHTNVTLLLICEDICAVGKSIRIGRDDFVMKPYQISEIVARLDSILVRYHQKIQHKHKIRAGQMMIDLNNRVVHEGGREFPLTSKEFDLLVLLARSPGQVFSKRQIYNQVWGSSFDYYDRNLMSFISKLRKKVEPDIKIPTYILTHWGVGYYFNDKI